MQEIKKESNDKDISLNEDRIRLNTIDDRYKQEIQELKKK